MRNKSPFPPAFAFTAVAALLLWAGPSGYTVTREGGHPFGHWTGEPVGWEIAVGLACAVAAVYFWRRTWREVTGGANSASLTRTDVRR
jgi:hypothetical protein